MKKFGLAVVLALGGCSYMPGYTETLEEIVINEPYLPSPMEVKYVEVEQRITPEVYAVAATRATNKMLNDTAGLYENGGTVFIYINDPKNLSEYLPDGFHYARKVTRDIIAGSKNYKVVNNIYEADYILDVLVDNLGSPEDPLIEYKLILFDDQNIKIDEWPERLRQLKNDDRSWW